MKQWLLITCAAKILNNVICDYYRAWVWLLISYNYQIGACLYQHRTLCTHLWIKIYYSAAKKHNYSLNLFWFIPVHSPQEHQLWIVVKKWTKTSINHGFLNLRKDNKTEDHQRTMDLTVLGFNGAEETWFFVHLQVPFMYNFFLIAKQLKKRLRSRLGD